MSTDQNTRPTPSSDVETLGRFQHHPDPAIDFEIEIECLQARLFDAKGGLSKPGTKPEPIEAVLADIERAMTFVVGGDQGAISAKADLRSLEKDARHALSRLSTPAQVVKPLEWEDTFGNLDPNAMKAVTVVGTYTITPCNDAVYFNGKLIEGLSGHSGAQKHFDETIHSALITTPAQVEVTEERIDHIASTYHSMGGADSWRKHPAKYRNHVRKLVREVIAAIEETGLKLARPSALTATDAKPVSHEHIEVTDAGLQGFAEWFRKNYPGPDTLIHKPDWHSPKIYRAALHHARSTDAKPVVPAEPTEKPCPLCGGKNDNVLSDICMDCENEEPWREPLASEGKTDA